MDVLIITGVVSAFLYSVFGMFFYGTEHAGHYLFFETGTTIISLVLLGNLIEKRSVKQTASDMFALQRLKINDAKKVERHNGHEHIHNVQFEDIRKGDMFLVNEGDRIPIDGTLMEGEITVNESLISGESLPLFKNKGSSVIGGTINIQGTAYIIADTDSKQSVLQQIIETVKKAQSDKPPVQKLADKISGIFVPVVIAIALVSFGINYFLVEVSMQDALMRSIAVLVISCPCAMGLATPTAVMVGIGKAARNGILVTRSSALEVFAKTRILLFDKTGTLTDGNFKFQFAFTNGVTEDEAKNIIYNLEKFSSHPIAKSLIKNKDWFTQPLQLNKMEEQKGKGIKANTDNGDTLYFGTYKSDKEMPNADIYLVRNDVVIAGIRIADEWKEEVRSVLDYFKTQQMQSNLLSGDSEEKCNAVKDLFPEFKVFSRQTPFQKLEKVEQLTKQGLTAMIGDGINDAPALNRASVAISFANATEIAQQSAQLILMRSDFKTLQKAHTISVQTYQTIKQNLFWAFAYNIVAIPLAAAGYMHPMLAAASMAFSDVIVIGNAIRLRYTKI